ncbi:thioesterase II family protein [Xanthobacter agilis]|uniref:Surfactin synthase thioesterase subunit n=1 Tax=Xanthobacter agilis TaxID=47492 RepID=A0ABU0LD85_XANAG|nr:alpha/beta fold hydrolase [Xanthobacter agilis]MDQ0505098.1 surfactin synthase thioesterase subunit [Xanthobacter agilis]
MERAPARLVLLPHAGGSVAALPWRARLPRAVAEGVVDLELPGHGRRFGAPFAPSLRALAAALAADIRAAVGDVPVLFQGHSMGALLAYEIARERCAQGGAVAGLVLSGRAAPRWPAARDAPPRHLCADAVLVDELRRLGGTPAEVLAAPDLMDLVLPVVRDDFRLVETYRWEPGPRLRVPAVVLGGRDDPATSPAALAAWGEVITGPLRVEHWPGGHFFPYPEPQRLADLIGHYAVAAPLPAGAHAG